eukprot:scaffold546413_cov15-Prasinocladus_malaysianus.AAC.1
MADAWPAWVATVGQREACRQGVEVEVRTLQAGDAIWLARSKTTGQEYVLDAMLERKSVDDLSGSIKVGHKQPLGHSIFMLGHP